MPKPSLLRLGPPLGSLLLGILAPSTQGATTLYGVTATDLVSINPSTGLTSVIGSLGLAANQTAGPLAWHPGDQQLYGLFYDYTVVGGLPVVTQQRFARINPTDGSWQALAVLGNPAEGPTYDALEYFDTLGSLVTSRSSGAGQTSARFLDSLSTSGTLTPWLTTTLDNDLLAFDGAHGRAYSVDPNGTQEIRQIQLGDGSHSVLAGGLPSTTTGELAYDLGSDRLYALDYSLLPTPNRNLYSIDTAGGSGPVSFSTATQTDVQVRGIAFAPVPEPAKTATVGLVAAAAALLGRGWRWRRK